MANGAAAAAVPSNGSQGAIFKGVEDDEIGAVFDQVLSSGSASIKPTVPQRMSDDDSEEHSDATRVMDVSALRALAEATEGTNVKGSPLSGLGSSAKASSNGVATQVATPTQHEWFVAIDERQVGPLTMEKVKDHWDRGEIGPDSLCWRSGFSDWIPVSEASELAVVLAPRPAKPVISAPVATVVSSAPVSSAFSAGTPRPSRTDAPMLSPEAPTDGASVAWKPTAASALASLVQDEMAALDNKKPAKSNGSNGRTATNENIPVAPASSGLLDVPPDAPASMNPAPNMPAASDRGPPQPSNYSTAAYVPTYTLPPPAPARGRGALIAVIAVVATLGLGLLGAIVFFLYQSANRKPEVVTVAPVVVPQPVAVVPTTPTTPVTTKPTTQTTPTPTTTTPVASTPIPPPPPEPYRPGRGGNRHGEHGRHEKEPAAGVATKETPPSTASKIDDKEPSGDEFEKEFGNSNPSKPPPQKNAKNNNVYVPPPPGESIPDTLEQSDIMQVVVSHKPAIVKCVDEQKKREPEKGGGKMVIRWSVLPSGKTANIAVQTDEMKGSYLASCLSGQVKSWSFPRHKVQGEPIDFPFTF